MAMNFFDHQEVAKRKTGRLILLFIIAVILIITALYLFVATFRLQEFGGSLWQFQTFFIVTGITLLLGCLIFLWKVTGLVNGGGSAVAESVGAVEVNPATGDPAERRYINVVEEMAIASGVAAPSMYILQDEDTINAFAAGYSPHDAAVAVTRGCIEQLSRAELQGVVAHEFSHILNGDMRLNIRLIGVLSCILFLAYLGYVLIRIGGSATRSRSKEGGGGAAIMFIFGLGLLLIGWIGSFFAGLIKAAVSRQREFLADASAVQFTRNPEGISGALRKIGGFGDKVIENPHAQEISHMCFSNIVTGFFNFSTHPPLPDRISRIEEIPLEAIGPGMGAGGRRVAAGAAGIAGGSRPEGKRKKRRKRKAVRARAADVIDSTGMVTAAGIENAASTVAGIPAELSEALRHPFTAMALSYLLVLPVGKRERRAMIRSALGEIISAAELKEVVRLERRMPQLDPLSRLPLLETAAPALRLLTRDQAGEFLSRIGRIVNADDKVDLREFCFLLVIEFCVHGGGRLRRKSRKRYRDIGRLAPDFSRILSILAEAGHDQEEDCRVAFEKAREALEGKIDIDYTPGAVAGAELKRSIGRLARSTMPIRRELFTACAQCVLADGVVEVEEAELLRAFSHAIGVPLPPLLSDTDSDL